MAEVIKGLCGVGKILSVYRKALLVHGKSYERHRVKDMIDRLPHADFTDFSSNPLYEDVCRGVDLFNAEGCDVIVAVGGGSAIDVAKCIKLFCRMDRNKNYLEQERMDTGIPLIAMPTTAGTGSESTRYAVIYYKGEKQSICHDSIVPDYAFLVPEFLKGLPTYQKKCTMMDALCQAIESWWSVNSNDESRGYSRKAVAGIRDNWKEYINNNTEKAAEKIMEAANFAGRAINIASTTSAHAMSYKITSLYNLPHGHAVAVCMVEAWRHILEHTGECRDSRGDEYLKDTLQEIHSLVDYDWYCRLLAELGIEKPKGSDRQASIKLLAESVNLARLKNNPVTLGTETLKEMYERIIEA